MGTASGPSVSPTHPPPAHSPLLEDPGPIWLLIQFPDQDNPMKALLDTGASTSLLSMDLAQQWNFPLQMASTNIIDVTGTQSQSAYQVSLSIFFQHLNLHVPITFLIMEHQYHPVIIGRRDLQNLPLNILLDGTNIFVDSNIYNLHQIFPP